MTNKELAKAWFTAIDENDASSIKKLMAGNHSFHNPMSPAPIGADEHLAMIGQISSAMTGSHLLELTISEGEYVAVKGSWKGKHTGEYNGIAATGNAINFSFTDIFHIVNGKVAEEYFEFNPMTLMTQMGAVTAQ